jgi:hypothetical protein
MTQIREQGPALSETKVTELERNLRAQLPESYRRFLLANNGGRPRPDTVDVPGVGPTDVQTIFGIGRAIASSGLEENRKTYAGRIPNALLPVACDSGGGLFCVALIGEDRGKIFFCDLYGWFGVEPSSKPNLVAPDFDSFLARLREPEQASA